MASEAAKFFEALPQNGKIMAEYVWIGGSGTTGGFDMRSKAMVLNGVPSSVAELRDWNYDGSSTAQAPGTDSEVILKPRAIFKDPFRGGDNILVMCDTWTPQGEPLPTNTREPAMKIFEQYGAKTAQPWFGIEQEYTLYENDKVTPVGWPKNGYPAPQGPYYCSAGADCSWGRDIAQAHVKACLFAGITLSGINAEVMPGQWEYQVGPCTAIDSGDHLWMSRYLMIRVCEMFDKIVTFEPKPMKGDWNGAGCHTNFSTEEMRQEGGYAKIIEAIEKMGKMHKEHMSIYGEKNEERMTGEHETANYHEFSYGVANRGASIRIPRSTEAEGKGYFEDRRPASNMDPYVVTSGIFKCVQA